MQNLLGRSDQAVGTAPVCPGHKFREDSFESWAYLRGILPDNHTPEVPGTGGISGFNLDSGVTTTDSQKS